MKSEEDCVLLQRDLDSVYGWAEINCMSFNSKKFQHLRYAATTEMPEVVYLSPSGDPVMRKPDVVDLGVTLSASVKFTEHIGHISKRARQRLVGC